MEATENAVPPWYAKLFACLKNGNRINPAKVELPHCDFFIVGPRRTLRILKPPLKAGWYYESTNDRPESINDNFFTRWSRRPHPSGNCRCSFRQSTRLSTTEEQIITAEINKIRTSLCEAEKAGRDIEELEQKLTENLENLIPVTKEPGSERDHAGLTKVTDGHGVDEKVIKNKIVKDLEKYINDLLEEILTDTVKFIADSEKFVAKDHDCASSVCMDINHLNSCKSFEEIRSENPSNTDAEIAEEPEENGIMFNNISFEFHSDSDSVIQKEDSKVAHQTLGYTNPAFLGSSNDPDAVEFYLNRPVCKIVSNCTLEHLDCVDSGINSVETIEFQPEQEQSLEESLMEIIDAKLGRTNLRKSWVDLRSEMNDADNIPEKTKEETCPQVEEKLDEYEEKKLGIIGMETVGKQQEDTVRRINLHDDKNDSSKERNQDNNITDTCNGRDKGELVEITSDPSFEKLRLEFSDETYQGNVQLRKNIGAPISRKKLRASNNKTLTENYEGWDDHTEEERVRRTSKLPPVEMQDYRKRWSELEESCSSYCEQNPRDFVMFRKNRKPMIVFLHGFGSCAEVFTSQLEYFSSLGYPCIAPDMLGHGMSSAPDRPREYHFDKLLKDLDMVLQHYAFQPGQKCVLVAHNYGCSFAAALACKYDSNIHQLVLISGGGPTPLARPSAEGAGHCCLRATLAPLLMCGLRREFMYSVRGRQHPYCGQEPMEQWPSHMKYVLDGMVWQEGDHIFHRRICTPALLIHGLRDKKVSLVQECQMERTMVKAFLEALPSAGHSPMTDCPEQLNHMIHCFIDLWKNKKW